MSTALNSNAINVTAGLLIPGSLAGLGVPGGQDLLVAAWFAGLTLLALALAWRGRGLRRLPGTLIIAGYLTFTAALAVSVAWHSVSLTVAVVPATTIVAAGVVLLAWPARDQATGGRWRRASAVPGWDTGRLWKLTLISCSVVAACDAATGPHLVLTGVLATGPCCALLTARWQLAASGTCYALALGTILGIPDHVFATTTQFTLLVVVAAIGATATAGAALLQRQQP